MRPRGLKDQPLSVSNSGAPFHLTLNSDLSGAGAAAMAVLFASVLAETLPRRASIALICAFRASISARRAAESLADAACALAVAGMSANAEHVVTSVVIFRFIGSPFREPSGPMNVLYKSEEHTSELQSLMRISY